MSATAKGNNPGAWEKLLTFLDDRLQLGLLDHLRHVESYHFEDNILTVQPSSDENYQYLNKPAVFQQLQLLAQEATGVEKVKVVKP